MPHKAYGIEWPLYRESKEYLEAKKAKAQVAMALTPQRALSEAAHYWPPEALPFAYAVACVDIVLLRSPEASAAYYEVIEALELPGCQLLIGKARIHASDTNRWSSETIKAQSEGKAVSGLPRLWFDAYKQYKDNADCLLFIERIHEFIRIGFNRQVDRENERYKVLAEKAPFLFGVSVFRTIAEHCKVRLEHWNKYRPDDIDRIMTRGDPTTRTERLRIRPKKKEIRETYEHLKWALRHDAKLLKYAYQWYQCRVNPGSIEVYLDKLDKQARKIDTSKFTKHELKKFEATYYPSRSNIETAIAPFDEATGYPRKWRK